MLRIVMKRFDAHVPLTVGDIVDVSTWKNGAQLEVLGYLGPTDATKATVSNTVPKKEARKSTASADTQPVRKLKKKSALASRPRVFRKAKQGE